jgi:gluconate 2-dehydrogenase gamma chain
VAHAGNTATGSAPSIKLAEQHMPGKGFADLDDQTKDNVLRGVEDGAFSLDGVDGKAFFATVIRDVQMGFFADPLYGGNRDMVAWKMIGYPGARYNYLD